MALLLLQLLIRETEVLIHCLHGSVLPFVNLGEVELPDFLDLQVLLTRRCLLHAVGLEGALHDFPLVLDEPVDNIFDFRVDSFLGFYVCIPDV